MGSKVERRMELRTLSRLYGRVKVWKWGFKEIRTGMRMEGRPEDLEVD